jgi:hypothetical protein
MDQLPSTFVATREALRALACYAIAPARKARTGRIGLRPTGDGLGTPTFDDGSRIVVRGDRLIRESGDEPGDEPVDVMVITTVRAACAFLDVEPSADPGVGHDLPPYAPDAVLDVDPVASVALGEWYAFGQRVLDDLAAHPGYGTVSDVQLWPEHFDLAVVVEASSGPSVNVGFSPGDDFHALPYVYVGPHDPSAITGDFWNAPFGAMLEHREVASSQAPHDRALAFVQTGLRLASTGSR